MDEFYHTPVLKNEVIQYLNPRPNQNFIDCTLGGGGHTLAILKKIAPNGKMLGIDLDEEAIIGLKFKVRNSKLRNNLILVRDNFKNLTEIYNQYFKSLPVSGVLLDLGVSSPQFDNPKRGFSFKEVGELGMNFDQRADLKAGEIVNQWPKKELEKIFKEYGEEKFSGKIADAIIKAREIEKIITTEQLANIVKKAIPEKFKVKKYSKKFYKTHIIIGPKIHPATKVFQALRIAVNDELENLRRVLPQIAKILEKGGRIAAISFHSLEDRIIKRFFIQESKGCVCPPSFPVCRCDRKPNLKILTKKPIVVGRKEFIDNPRSRSAKLRAAEIV